MTTAKPKQAKALIVQSVTEQGRWRAGRKFTRAPVTLDDLDEEQAAAIKADPMLIVKDASDQNANDNVADTKAADDQAAGDNVTDDAKAADDQAAGDNVTDDAKAADDQTAGDTVTTDAMATDTKPAPKAKAAKPKADV